MKKTVVLFVIVVATVTYLKVNGNAGKIPMGYANLFQVEALAGCETSSDKEQNKGYCIPKYGGGGDACVESSDSDAVRCSGNI